MEFTRRGLIRLLPAAIAAKFCVPAFPAALQPIAAPSDRPRTFDHPMGDLSHADLRKLAEHPFVRTCIEKAKDRISRLCGPWASISGSDEQALYEEMLVLDAGNIYDLRPLSTRPRDRYLVLSGDSIELMGVIDPMTGDVMRMRPPLPAYQLKTWNAVCTSDELIYRPRNIVPRGWPGSHLYGVSPVEEIADMLPLRNGPEFVAENLRKHEAIRQAFGLDGNHERMLSFCKWVGEMRAAIGEPHYAPNVFLRDGLPARLSPGNDWISGCKFSNCQFSIHGKNISFYQGAQISQYDTGVPARIGRTGA